MARRARPLLTRARLREKRAAERGRGGKREGGGKGRGVRRRRRAHARVAGERWQSKTESPTSHRVK
eukprot:scaffold53659_cov31-Tisochrysis_lutea.AAC.3